MTPDNPKNDDTLSYGDLAPQPVGAGSKPKPSKAQAEAEQLLQAAGQPAGVAAVSPAPAPEPHGNPLQQLEATPRPTPTKTTFAAPPTPAQVAAQTPLDPNASRLQRSYSWMQQFSRRFNLRTVTRYTIIGIVSVAVFFLVFNFPIWYADIKYHFSTPAPQPSVTASTTPGALTQAVSVGSQPLVIIPKINVNAPIEFVPTLDENAILAGLQNGVVHYANTGLPGAPGNTVLFGHSSNDWWEPGNFKFIFALLDRLTIGDTIQVNYNSKRYIYQVTGTKVVDPTDFSVIQQTYSPELTLITCTPPGTSWKRLVVVAKQIDPPVNAAPSTNQPGGTVANLTQPAVLPGDAPSSVWTKVTNFFHKLF